MIYKQFQDKQLSMLGFGTMRLPTLEGGAIDEAQVAEMVKYENNKHNIDISDKA